MPTDPELYDPVTLIPSLPAIEARLERLAAERKMLVALRRLARSASKGQGGGPTPPGAAQITLFDRESKTEP